MGSYFARSKLGWTLASAIFSTMAGCRRPLDPAQIMDRSLVMNRSPSSTRFWDEHYDAIVAGVEQPLKDDGGHQVPGVRGYDYRDPWANPSWTPRPKARCAPGARKHSMWRAARARATVARYQLIQRGGRGQSWCRKSTSSRRCSDTGGWRVTIVDWQAWFWDTYDWNLAGQSVSIPLNLFKVGAQAVRVHHRGRAENETPRFGAAGNQSSGCTDEEDRGQELPCRTEPPSSRRATRSTVTVRGISMRAARAESRSI